MTRTTGIVIAAAGVGLAATTGMLLRSGNPPKQAEKRRRAEVKRAVSGHKIKLETDEYLMYAGIRAPYAKEPLHQESKQRNAELVDGKKVRLRFGTERRDGDDRLLAYVSVDNTMVNELLVREGLAYARLTPDVPQRFADLLLAAQQEARGARRGLWRHQPRSTEPSYPADPKYASFHRPECETARRIKPERRVEYSNRDEALAAGLAPCSKCLP